MNSNPNPSPAPLLLNAEEVALRLGISKSSVWRLRDRGLLPQPVRFGALVRWRAVDVEVWVARGCPELAEARNAR